MNHPITPILQKVETPVEVGKFVAVVYKNKTHTAQVVEIREVSDRPQMLLVKLVGIRQPILVWNDINVRALPTVGKQVSILYQPWYDHQVANNERTGLSTELSKRECFWLSQIATLDALDKHTGLARISSDNQKTLTLPLNCLVEYEINF